MELILASASPRRREILSKAGFAFRAVPSGAEEDFRSDCPAVLVSVLSLKKAASVFEKTGGVVLGSDTVVALDGKILGKPADRKEAREMLQSLSGRVHEVYSGYAIISPKRRIVGYDSAEVVFNQLSEKTVDDYVSSGLGLDKAGAYGVQDGFGLVKEIRGSFCTVMGLPIEKIIPMLNKELLI